MTSCRYVVVLGHGAEAGFHLAWLVFKQLALDCERLARRFRDRVTQRRQLLL